MKTHASSAVQATGAVLIPSFWNLDEDLFPVLHLSISFNKSSDLLEFIIK